MKQIAYGLMAALFSMGAMGLSVASDCPDGKYFSNGVCKGKPIFLV
jgi:hypothetical protein